MLSEKKTHRRRGRNLAREVVMSDEYRRFADQLEAAGKHFPAHIFREIAEDVDKAHGVEHSPAKEAEASPEPTAESNE